VSEGSASESWVVRKHLRPPLAWRDLENPATQPKNRCFEAHCFLTSPRQELNLKCSLKPLTMSCTAASVGRIPRRTVSCQHLRCIFSSTNGEFAEALLRKSATKIRTESDKPDSNTEGKFFYLFPQVALYFENDAYILLPLSRVLLMFLVFSMGSCEWQPCLKVIGPRKYNISTDEALVDFKKVSLQIG